MHHRINLQPLQATLDGSELSPLIDAWLDDIRSHAPPITHRTYCSQIDRVRRWWLCAGPEKAWVLRRSDLHECASHLATRYGWHAQNDALRRFRSCLHWAFENGYLGVDCAGWVPSPIGQPPLVRRRAGLDDLAALLKASAEGETGVRDVAIIAMLLGTGMRRAECAMLNVGDVQMDADCSGSILIAHAKRVRGRVTQSRIVAMDQWTGRRLQPWLDMHPFDGPLWLRPAPNKRGYLDERLTIDSVGRVVLRSARRAGLDTIRGAHDLRRHFATFFAARNRGNQIAGHLLSQQLGHSRFVMTERYLLDDIEELRAAIRSPLAP